MCGRYYVDDETAREIQKLVREINGKLEILAGDVRPSQEASVIAADREAQLELRAMHWGFPDHTGKQLIINARSESALDKKTFKESVLKRRCIIPARGFYEWDRAKNKYTFSRADAPMIYMAGFYRRFESGDRFVILTTAANFSVEKVHDRMPLILEPEEMITWVTDDQCVPFILNKRSVELRAETLYEQQRLPFL